MKLVIASVISLLSFSALAAPEGTLSVHILNQQTGLPSPGCRLSWINSRGRAGSISPPVKRMPMGGLNRSIRRRKYGAGVYKVTFKTGDYFKSQNMNTFFPVIPVIFNVTKQNQKLHIPLLLSQYGYSTYRGS